jgi:acid stress-induced BolA-like protein IbaG/YrbA
MLENEVKSLIIEALPDAKVDISGIRGTHNHLEITVASDSFNGLSLIEQHQKIMDVLKEPLGTRVLHAVKLKTLLLKDYQE